MDKPQMTEEEFLELMGITCVFPLSKEGLQTSLENAKQAGYITRPAWEEAEEIHQEFSKCEVEYISGSAIAKYIETACKTIAALKKSHDILKQKADLS